MPTLPLTVEQLENRLLALHESSLELVREISIDTLLEKIASIAMEQANASYAAVGLLDAEGLLEKFIPMGMNCPCRYRNEHSRPGYDPAEGNPGAA